MKPLDWRGLAEQEPKILAPCGSSLLSSHLVLGREQEAGNGLSSTRESKAKLFWRSWSLAECPCRTHTTIKLKKSI